MQTELLMFGYQARLIIDIDGEDHDISHLLKISTTPERYPNEAGWVLEARALATEIDVERRARARASNGPRFDPSADSEDS